MLVSQSPDGNSQPGYQRELVPGTSLCQFWPSRSFVYTVDSAGYPQAPGDSAFTAIDAAFHSWQALSDSCSDLQFSAGPRRADVPVGYDQANPSANVNAVVFRTQRCSTVVPATDPCVAGGTCAQRYRCWDYDDVTIAQTTTTFSLRTGAILDADIELNAAPHAAGAAYLFTTVDAPRCDPAAVSEACVATDVQNTLTHEIGHTLGFDHVGIDGSTMEPTAELGETRKRVIDPGTAQGFCDVYLAGQPVPSCDDTSRQRLKIVAGSHGTGFPSCSAGAGAPALWLGAWVAGGRLRFRRRGRSRPAAR